MPKNGGIRGVLESLSSLTGSDLVSTYEQARADGSRTSGDKGDQGDDAAAVRAALPNHRTRRRFDKELTWQEKRNREGHRNQKANNRRIRALEKRLNLSDGEAPKAMPAHLFKQTKYIRADLTGQATNLYLKMCSNKIAVGLIKRAALSPDADGTPRYSFSGTDRGANRARMIAALGLLYVGLAAKTGRKGDRWNGLVKGIPQSAILAALSDPSTKKRPARSSMSSTKREPEKTATDGRVGYLKALFNVRLLYFRQAHWREGQPITTSGWDDISENEIPGNKTKTGWYVSLGRYWVVTDSYQSPRNAATRAALWLDWLAGVNPWPETGEDAPQSPPPSPETAEHQARPPPTPG